MDMDDDGALKTTTMRYPVDAKVSAEYERRLELAEQLKDYAAHDDGSPPKYYCTKEVKRRFEPLSPVILNWA